MISEAALQVFVKFLNRVAEGEISLLTITSSLTKRMFFLTNNNIRDMFVDPALHVKGVLGILPSPHHI